MIASTINTLIMNWNNFLFYKNGFWFVSLNKHIEFTLWYEMRMKGAVYGKWVTIWKRCKSIYIIMQWHVIALLRSFFLYLQGNLWQSINVSKKELSEYTQNPLIMRQRRNKCCGYSTLKTYACPWAGISFLRRMLFWIWNWGKRGIPCNFIRRKLAKR